MKLMVKRLPVSSRRKPSASFFGMILSSIVVGGLRIELGVLRRLALVEELMLGLRRHLRRSALPDIDEIDDLLTVDRVAERDAEILVLEDLPLRRRRWS